MASYYVWSGATGAGTGANWANAFTTLTTAFVTEVAGDTLYVAHDHNESTAGALALNSGGTLTVPTKVICVDRGGSVPPVSADRRTTAQVSTSGAFGITTNGGTYYDGIIFTAGVGTASGVNFNVVNSSNQWQRFDNCSIRIAATANSASTFITFGGTAAGATSIELNNTTISLGAVGQILAVSGFLKWRNTPSALLGTIPTLLFIPNSARGGSAECIGVDFSAAGAGKTIVDTQSAQASVFTFIDCKLHASVTKSTVPNAHGAPEINFVRSGASGVNYTIHRHRCSGLLTEETTIVRTGGASDGTTPIAWKIVTTSNSNYLTPFECPPIAIWNDTVGSPVTATVEGIGAALPTDQEVWVDAEYLGDASSPQGSFVNDGTPDLLTTPANQTTSTATWGGSTAKFKLNVTFTPQQKGWVYARVKIGKAASTFYIDPLITLT